jgi:hypothetical protein
MNAFQKQVQAVMTSCVGKTLESVDATSVNLMTLRFSDGTGVHLATEYTGIPNLYGIAAEAAEQPKKFKGTGPALDIPQTVLSL